MFRTQSLSAGMEPSHRRIRDDQKYNEVERGVQASVVTSMGRMAAHTGQEVTYDEMLNCEHTSYQT